MSHFEARQQDSRPFGYLYTDQEYGGAINILSDFVMISWS